MYKGIFTWFHTYGRKQESLEKFRDVKKWTARKVLGVEAKEELKTMIQQKTGGWNGMNSGQADNQKAFGMYQVELSRLWEGVPEQEKARLEEVAALWNQMGPPPDQQAKFAFLASSCRQSWIIDVALEMQRRHTSTFGPFASR